MSVKLSVKYVLPEIASPPERIAMTRCTLVCTTRLLFSFVV
ncbi:MAG: hypothetical protein JWP12_3549 [Bacteroidetes bacterium]|nr:hypothetical protein [Bacteroidota bacterium]